MRLADLLGLMAEGCCVLLFDMDGEEIEYTNLFDFEDDVVEMFWADGYYMCFQIDHEEEDEDDDCEY